MGKKYLIVSIGLVLLLVVSCGKKMIPTMTTEPEVKTYDTAAFNFVYVNAIKLKLMGNGSEALRYFEQCIEINSGSDASYYQMAQIILNTGDLKNGKRFAEKAFSLDPGNIWYHMMLAGIYYQEQNIDSAIVFYEKAISNFPEKVSIQLALGNLYTEKGDFSKANSIFNSLDEKFGINESSTLGSIRNFMAMEKYDEALVKAGLLLQQYPDEVLYNGLLAEIYRGKGDNEKAFEVYKELIDRNPDNPQIQLSLCDFLITEKSYDELFMLLNTIILNTKVTREDKITLFAQLLEVPDLVGPNGNSLIISLMLLEANFPNDDIIPLLRPEALIKQGKLDESSLRLEEIIKDRPDNYNAWERLLLVYLELGDYTKLMIRGEECATRFNRSFLAKILYANGAIENGKYTTALEELKKAEILAGGNQDFKIQVLTMRADVYYRMKSYNEAFKIFQEAINESSEDLTVMNNYAYYLAEQNMNLKEAEVMAKKVIDTERENTTFLDTYGWVLYKRGKLKEAARIMEEVINSGDKPDAEWYEHYGYILKKQRKCSLAIDNWKIAISIDSTKVNLIKEIENCIK